MSEARAVFAVLVAFPGATVVTTTTAVRDECRAQAEGRDG